MKIISVLLVENCFLQSFVPSLELEFSCSQSSQFGPMLLGLAYLTKIFFLGLISCSKPKRFKSSLLSLPLLIPLLGSLANPMLTFLPMLKEKMKETTLILLHEFELKLPLALDHGLPLMIFHRLGGVNVSRNSLPG